MNDNTDQPATPSSDLSISSYSSDALAPGIIDKKSLSYLLGWQEVQDEQGNTYYFNESTNETTWDRPVTKASLPAYSPPAYSPSPAVSRPPLPSYEASIDDESLMPGWAECLDDFGNLYYYNESTGQTSWYDMNISLFIVVGIVLKLRKFLLPNKSSLNKKLDYVYVCNLKYSHFKGN